MHRSSFPNWIRTMGDRQVVYRNLDVNDVAIEKRKKIIMRYFKNLKKKNNNRNSFMHQKAQSFLFAKNVVYRRKMFIQFFAYRRPIKFVFSLGFFFFNLNWQRNISLSLEMTTERKGRGGWERGSEKKREDVRKRDWERGGCWLFAPTDLCSQRTLHFLFMFILIVNISCAR